MENKYERYIEEFNNGEFDSLLEYFDTMENILKFFKYKGLLKHIDIFNSNLEDYQLEIINFLINELNDKQTINYCVKQFSDVVEKDGRYYLKLKNRSELSKLFYAGSNNVSTSEIVEMVLGDDSWEPYYDTTDDVYSDVIEELDSENLAHLKEYMLEVLGNIKIDVDDDCPDLFQELKNDEGFFWFTEDMVESIINDSESMNYLMDEGYLENLKSELYSIHSNAYNEAYTLDIFEEITTELGTFFDMTTAKWEVSGLKNNHNELVEYYIIKFNPNEVENSIKNYVSDRDIWGDYQANIDYQSSWLNIIGYQMEYGGETYLDFRVPDYPDHLKVVKYINENFKDYL